MAFERPPYSLHFLQPDEAMPTRGSTDDWGGCRLWKDKQQGLCSCETLDAPGVLPTLSRWFALLVAKAHKLDERQGTTA